MGSLSDRVNFPQGLRVLLLDDGSAECKVSEKLLRDCSYEVRVCETQEAAAKLLNAEELAAYDLALVEMSFAEASYEGLSTCEFIKQHSVPVVVMASNVDTSMVMQSIKLGAADVLQRPLDRYSARKLWQHAIRKLVKEESRSSMNEANNRGSFESTCQGGSQQEAAKADVGEQGEGELRSAASANTGSSGSHNEGSAGAGSCNGEDASGSSDETVDGSYSGKSKTAKPSKVLKMDLGSNVKVRVPEPLNGDAVNDESLQVTMEEVHALFKSKEDASAQRRNADEKTTTAAPPKLKKIASWSTRDRPLAVRPTQAPQVFHLLSLSCFCSLSPPSLLACSYELTPSSGPVSPSPPPFQLLPLLRGEVFSAGMVNAFLSLFL